LCSRCIYAAIFYPSALGSVIHFVSLKMVYMKNRWTILLRIYVKHFSTYLLVIPIPRMKELIAVDDTPLLLSPASVNSRGSSHPSTHLSVTSRFSCKTQDVKSNYIIEQTPIEIASTSFSGIPFFWT
jgi:hypothetical protein